MKIPTREGRFFLSSHNLRKYILQLQIFDKLEKEGEAGKITTIKMIEAMKQYKRKHKGLGFSTLFAWQQCFHGYLHNRRIFIKRKNRVDYIDYWRLNRKGKYTLEKLTIFIKSKEEKKNEKMEQNK